MSAPIADTYMDFLFRLQPIELERQFWTSRAHQDWMLSFDVWSVCCAITLNCIEVFFLVVQGVYITTFSKFMHGGWVVLALAQAYVMHTHPQLYCKYRYRFYYISR
jgi:hypothetical protein